MELTQALAASDLRAELKLNRDETEGLRGLIATTTSADIRAWAGLDLIRLTKKASSPIASPSGGPPKGADYTHLLDDLVIENASRTVIGFVIGS